MTSLTDWWFFYSHITNVHVLISRIAPLDINVQRIVITLYTTLKIKRLSKSITCILGPNTRQLRKHDRLTWANYWRIFYLYAKRERGVNDFLNNSYWYCGNSNKCPLFLRLMEYFFSFGKMVYKQWDGFCIILNNFLSAWDIIPSKTCNFSQKLYLYPLRNMLFNCPMTSALRNPPQTDTAYWTLDNTKPWKNSLSYFVITVDLSTV